MEDRYQVVEGSQSAHCCFEATVVDTTKPLKYGSGFDQVCECLEVTDAERIAEALNAFERNFL